MKLAEIAARLDLKLAGASTEVEIRGVAGIEDAQPGELTFVSNPKYGPLASSTKASAIIVENSFPPLTTPTLRGSNPYFAFAKAIELFYQPPAYAPGIHPTAVVSPDAKIGRKAHIGAYVVVDSGVKIGADCVLLPHVVIYRGARIGNHFFAHAHSVVREFCEIGNNVTLQNGVVVGGDGYGFAKTDGGSWHKIVQSGKVILEDDVEVQANSCVDRASIGETRIGRGTKIDNLAQVGHGSSVGENSLLCAQVGLAGSSHIGNNVVLAGQSGVAGHCKVGDGVVLTAQSGTHGDIPPNKVISGSPAIDNRQWLRCVAIYNRLPEIVRQLRAAAKSDGKDSFHE